MMFSSGLGQKQKTNGLGPGFPDANVPEWSRDGSRIAFWSGIERNYGEVWTMDPDGGSREKVTETTDPRNSDNPSWSPDGARILFDSNRDGPVRVFSVNPDGSRLMPQIPNAFGQTAWQPVYRPRSPTYGKGCPGTKGLVPGLSVSGCPKPGGILTLSIDNGLPTASAALLFSALPASIPLPGGCTLLVAPPLVPIGVGLNRAGAFSVDVALSATAMPGTAHVQAFVVDSGVPHGFSNTEGVRVVVE